MNSKVNGRRPDNSGNPWQAPAAAQPQPPPQSVQAAAPLSQTHRFLLAAAALAGLLLGGILGLFAVQLLAEAADLLVRSSSGPHAASPGMAVQILLTLPLTLGGSIGGAWLTIRLGRRMLLRQPAQTSQTDN